MAPSADVWRRLGKWYRRHGRTLPWRDIGDAYRIVVSEFMLQQTQVGRVIPKFRAFIRRFPTWKALARASQADVVRAWKGLGYNMRAVRFRALAEQVVRHFDGLLPDHLEALMSLKGIGPYTARAIQAFVHRRDVLAPDTNIRRVLTRIVKGPLSDPRALPLETLDRWARTLPRGAGYDANQALMDLGATVCKAGVPRCPECPLKGLCRSYPRILSLTRAHLSRSRQVSAYEERVDGQGVPDRIHRGRVIDRLRRGPATAAELRAIGGRPDIVAKLEKDGFLLRKKGKWRLR